MSSLWPQKGHRCTFKPRRRSNSLSRRQRQCCVREAAFGCRSELFPKSTKINSLQRTVFVCKTEEAEFFILWRRRLCWDNFIFLIWEVEDFKQRAKQVISFFCFCLWTAVLHPRPKKKGNRVRFEACKKLLKPAGFIDEGNQAASTITACFFKDAVRTRRHLN